MSHRRFYEQLGRLVYALIAVDGSVVAAEIERSRTSIRNFVSRHTEFTRENNSAEALIVLVSFDHAVSSSIHPTEILKSFEQYASGPNTRDVSKSLLDEAYRLLVRAAASYKGIGTSEQTYLDKITHQFEQTWHWKKHA